MAKSRKCLKICGAVTILLLAILIITAVVLYYTVFKPKQPKVTTQDVTLDHFTANIFDVTDVNVTLGITVTINNPNYGGFKYAKSITHVTYHGEPVAEAPVPADLIPARGKHDVSTSVLVVGKSLVTNPNFADDFRTKVFNFTSTTTLKGKAIILKMFKKKATTYSSCDISVNFVQKNSTSVCKSNVKF